MQKLLKILEVLELVRWCHVAYSSVMKSLWEHAMVGR